MLCSASRRTPLDIQSQVQMQPLMSQLQVQLPELPPLELPLPQPQELQPELQELQPEPVVL